LPAARVPVPTLLDCGLGKQARCVWPGHDMRRSWADLDVAAGTTVGLGCRCSRYAADNPAAVTLDHRFRMSGAQRSGRPEMFTWPSRHDELLYWSCSRIALGIRRRCRRSQTESTSARSSSARRRVIADARSWGSSILVRFNHGCSWERPTLWRALIHASGVRGDRPLAVSCHRAVGDCPVPG
jgi:hypothetical protein